MNGSWTPAAHGRVFPVTNPATGAVITEVADMTVEDAGAAIDGAIAAQAQWRERSGKERAAVLRAWHAKLKEHREAIAALITEEQGKPLSEARGEVEFGASFVEWFAEEAKRLYGDLIPGPTGDRRFVVVKQPIGVCAAITPWNFPLAMITRKVAAALAAGCSMVVKPSEETPLTALMAAQLATEAGVPDGLINVVTTLDAPGVGELFCRHEKVRKISFTGSTRVGKLLLERSAPGLKKVSLELGGNAPFIIFEDADLERAIEGVVAAKYRNSGQTCVCANRIFVHEAVHDAFVEGLSQRIVELRLGNGADETVTQGPLINERAVEKAEALVEDALARGAQLECGGGRWHPEAAWFEPTVLTSVDRSMRIANEEAFAPIAPVFRFRNDDEALEMANDTAYGLMAYLYTSDVSRMWHFGERLEVGMVGINEGVISSELAPFGGIKESGIGREGSKYGIDEYVEIKQLCFGGLRPS
ncbi:NAD-dependent succinate-semialdehyde dehydrogenase [Arhodomonas sp. SL1]|uniref:NAD-dependent succinate-semialdehyde dehydrogenase n=1 Tax=Arhodomonas sp. SL1 TaxID=3425691 RepID=UPI003F8808ED